MKPGESGQFAIRLAVRGLPGREHVEQLYFRTNDPTRLEHQIRLTVPAVLGLRTEPSAVVFGRQRLGTTQVQTVNFYNVGNTSETVTTVACDNDVFSCTFTAPPSNAQEKPGERVDPLRGTHLGTVNVQFTCQSPGERSGNLKVTLRRDNHDREVSIPISGRSVAAASIVPDRLSLPRMSETSRVYGATCLCMTEDGKPFVVAVESVIDGITVRVEEPDVKAATHRVQVKVAENLTPGTYVAKLKVIGETETTQLELPIDVRREE